MAPAIDRFADIALLLALAAALIVCSVLRSRGFPMWLDEIIAFNLITDPSTSHMLTSLGDQGDSGGPVYYLLARVWAAIFSASEMSLRLFTAAAFVGGVAILWALLRRYYDRWTCALAIGCIVGASHIIEFELSNVRFYGLLFATLALVCLTAARLDAAAERPRFSDLALNAVAVGALILSNPVGVVYAGMVFVAVFVAKIIEGRWRVLPAIMASYIAGLCFLLLWLRQYVRLSAINKPHSWVPVPELTESFSMVSPSFGIRWLAVVVMTVWLFEQIRSRRTRAEMAAEAPRSILPLTLALALCCIDPLFVLISVASSSLYLPRYMLGVSIGLIFALAELLRRVLPPTRSMTLISRVALGVAFAACLAEIVKPGEQRPRTFAAGTFDESLGYSDLPIVCTSMHSFVPRVHYSKRRERYFFLMDAEFARETGVTYKMADALRKYFRERYPGIVERAEFITTHPQFVVLSHITDPRERLRSEGYELTPLPMPLMPEGEQFFLATRRP